MYKDFFDFSLLIERLEDNIYEKLSIDEDYELNLLEEIRDDLNDDLDDEGLLQPIWSSFLGYDLTGDKVKNSREIEERYTLLYERELKSRINDICGDLRTLALNNRQEKFKGKFNKILKIFNETFSKAILENPELYLTSEYDKFIVDNFIRFCIERDWISTYSLNILGIKYDKNKVKMFKLYNPEKEAYYEKAYYHQKDLIRNKYRENYNKNSNRKKRNNND